MIFETIYDIRQAGCRDWFLAPAGLVLLILAWISGRRGTTVNAGAAAPSMGFMAVLFTAVTLLSFFMTWGQYWTLLRQLDRGEAQQLQGIVSDFQQAPGYRGTERFKLRGYEFSYSRFAAEQGFHMLAADGGPVVKGACIRLLHIGNHILRLERGKVGPGEPGDACSPGSAHHSLRPAPIQPQSSSGSSESADASVPLRTESAPTPVRDDSTPGSESDRRLEH